MADFPGNIWIRDPVIEGRPLKGGALNRAMALLKQCRDEITAIETALGTDPAGTAATVLARLAVRHSKSGIPRGRLYSVGNGTGWFTHGGLNVQIGITGAISGSTIVVTYPQAYTVAPSGILSRYVVHETDLLCGECQTESDQITTTSFRLMLRNFNAAGTFTIPSGSNRCYAIWMAIGGS